MKRCPYCGNPGGVDFKLPSRIYYRCRECGLIYKNIRDDYQEVLAGYTREGYFDRYVCDQIFSKRDKLYDHILDSLEVKNSFSRLLDVGTGCGFFLTAAQKKGWYVKGIDPSMQSVEVAISKNKLDVFHGSLKEYPDNDQFDAITFINVLDHSAEPWKEINLASSLLKPGGIVYFRFPNGFLHVRLYKLARQFRFADHIKKYLVFHEFCFTSKFIQKFLKDSGFSKIIVLNSPPSQGDPHNLFPAPVLAEYFKKLLYMTARTIQSLTSGRILVGTSLEILATKI